MMNKKDIFKTPLLLLLVITLPVVIRAQKAMAPFKLNQSGFWAVVGVLTGHLLLRQFGMHPLKNTSK